MLSSVSKRSRLEACFGFGRAVSRILSALLRAERIICLCSQYPGPVSLARDLERAAPGSPIWPCTRWGFPCLVACASSGALLPHLFTLALRGFQISNLRSEIHGGRFVFCGTVRRDASRRRRPRVSRPDKPGLRGIAPFGVRTFLPRFAPEAILRPSKTAERIAANWTVDKLPVKLVVDYFGGG